MMNSMQPSGALARSRLGTATKKMIALLLAAVMFLTLGVVGVIVTKAATTPPTPTSCNSTNFYGYEIVYPTGSNSYLSSITSVTVNDIDYTKGSGQYDTGDYSKRYYIPSGSTAKLRISNKETSLPATVVIKATGYDDISYIINSDGSITLTPSYEVPDGIDEVTGVNEVIVKKTWNPNSPSVSSITTTLYENGSAVRTATLAAPTWETTFSNLDSSKKYYVVESNDASYQVQSYSVTIQTTGGTPAGWEKKGYGDVEDGRTYAFTYTSNGTTYLLGRSGTSVIGTTNGLSGGIPQTSIGNDYKWKASKASSGTYYGEWLLQNLGNNYYLAPYNGYSTGYSNSAILQSSNSYYGNVNLHLDDDGSIWNDYGGLNLYANGSTVKSDSFSYTVFTPYVFTEGSETKTATYTITNTPTSVTPTESTYTLTYDANEGSGAPDADSKTDTNSTKDFTVSSAKPTREGYDFLGWADSKTATTANYQPGDPISLTGNKTIYAVWKEQEKPIEDPMPDFHKSITPTNQVSDNYTIQLNVTGKDKRVTSTTPGETVTETKPVDIVLVIDQTYSMNSTLSDGKTRLAAVQEAAKQFVSNLEVNEKSKISLISYECYNDDTRKTPVYVRQDWTPVTSSAKVSLTSKIDALTLTNYPRAYYTYYAPPLEQTADLLTASSVTNDGNKKYVIFFSDGEASDTYESELAQVKANSTVFAVGVESNDFMASTDKIKSVASDSSKYYEVGNTAEFVEAFNEALQTITSENTSTSSAIHLNNVTISDTLSDYVELSNTNASNNYGITVDNLTKDQYTVTVSGKTVTVKLKDNVTLEDGKTYTVNIPVKPTAKAQTEADAANANTSTFPSNTTASITYKYDGDPTTKNYTETPNILVAKTKTYTVTWKNEDGTVLETDTGLKLGDIPEYNGETPTKEKSNGLVYVFDGWDKEISPVNGDTTYTAKFKEVPQTDYVLHKTSHAMFILSALCAVTAGAMFAVEHYRRKRLTS